MENALVLLKPDVVQRGLAGAVISRLEARGLKIVALRMLRMDETLARRHYAVHEGKWFFDRLLSYITSGPLVAMVLEGKNAIEIVRRTMGETDPAKASPGTIRGDLGVDIGYNLVHGSDSLESAAQEIRLFFSPEEVLSYGRDVDRWITGP